MTGSAKNELEIEEATIKAKVQANLAFGVATPEQVHCIDMSMLAMMLIMFSNQPAPVPAAPRASGYDLVL